MLLNNLVTSTIQCVKSGFLNSTTLNFISVRNASKKMSSVSKNRKGHARPKHRGWKVQDGAKVTAGSFLATQLTTRFHPGLHVGFGKNGTLFAIEPGKVIVTCEKVNLNTDHTWIQRCYSERLGQSFYKKHFHVIPEKEHCNFKRVDLI